MSESTGFQIVEKEAVDVFLTKLEGIIEDFDLGLDIKIIKELDGLRIGALNLSWLNRRVDDVKTLAMENRELLGATGFGMLEKFVRGCVAFMLVQQFEGVIGYDDKQ